MKTKAAVMYEGKAPLVVEEIELDPPQAGEVLVKLAATAICRSDLHALNQDWPIPLPMVLGHEGAGVVEQVGEGVTRLTPGDPEGIILVMDGGRIAAYDWTLQSFGATGSVGWISMTGVHPDYRGKGLGTLVVTAGINHLKSNGVDTVELEVDSDNVPARELYLKLGFKKLRETTWYERRFD